MVCNTRILITIYIPPIRLVLVRLAILFQAAVYRLDVYKRQLWGICRRYYGDGSLAWRLAAANGIANANLIRPGQVLTIPPLAQLPAAAARPPSAKIAAATKVREVKEEESGTARLVPWVPENTVKSLADLELDKIASGGGLWRCV